MKVLHLVQQPQRRGAEMFAYDLTTELLTRGVEVVTVYLYPAQTNHLHTRQGDVEIDADPTHFFEKMPGVHPTVVQQLKRIVAEFRPDVVQANGARTLKYGAALKRFGSRPHSFAFVYRSIGDPLVWVNGRAKRVFYAKLVMPQVEGIAAVSSTSEQGLRELYRMDGKLVEQIPRGIDARRLAPNESGTSVRARLGAAADAPVVLFVGSLTTEKRPDRLVRAFADVVGEIPSAKLWIIGDGPERAAVELQLGQLDIVDHVTFVGATDDVGSYMGAANVLMLTSDTEGLPGVILEAACQRLAVVATNVGGVTDAIESGIHGVVVEPDDERGLARATVRLLTDPIHASRLADAAMQRFAERYSIETVADSYVKLYTAVMAADGRRR